MTDPQWDLQLRPQLVEITELLRPRRHRLVARLFSKGLINADEEQRLTQSDVTDTALAEDIFRILRYQPPGSFNKFCDLLLEIEDDSISSIEKTLRPRHSKVIKSVEDIKYVEFCVDHGLLDQFKEALRELAFRLSSVLNVREEEIKWYPQRTPQKILDRKGVVRFLVSDNALITITISGVHKEEIEKHTDMITRYLKKHVGLEKQQVEIVQVLDSNSCLLVVRLPGLAVLDLMISFYSEKERPTFLQQFCKVLPKSATNVSFGFGSLPDSSASLIWIPTLLGMPSTPVNDQILTAANGINYSLLCSTSIEQQLISVIKETKLSASAQIQLCGEVFRRIRASSGSRYVHMAANRLLILVSQSGLLHICNYLLHEVTNFTNFESFAKDMSPDKAIVSPVHAASRMGHLFTLKSLVRSEWPVQEIDREGNTPLHIASLNRHHLCVEYLLNSGANALEPNRFGYVAMHCAVQGGSLQTVKELGDHGVNYKSFRLRHSPLHLAVKQDKPALVKRLIAVGANPLQTSAFGLKATHYGSLSLRVFQDITCSETLIHPYRQDMSLLGSVSEIAARFGMLSRQEHSPDEIHGTTSVLKAELSGGIDSGSGVATIYSLYGKSEEHTRLITGCLGDIDLLHHKCDQLTDSCEELKQHVVRLNQWQISSTSVETSGMASTPAETVKMACTPVETGTITSTPVETNILEIEKRLIQIICTTELEEETILGIEERLQQASFKVEEITKSLQEADPATLELRNKIKDLEERYDSLQAPSGPSDGDAAKLSNEEASLKARREAMKLRKELLFKGFKTPSAKIRGMSPFNILLLGEVGSGKSTAINTFVTAMHDDEECYLPALSLGIADDLGTRYYKRYSLHPKSDIMLYDTCGIYLEQNYVDESLRRMLEGRMEDGGVVKWRDYSDRETSCSSGSDPLPYQQGDSVSSEASTVQARNRQIHMVVFCVDARSNWARPEITFDPSDYDIVLKIASLMKETYETSGILSAILLTCIDTLGARVLECGSPEEIREVPVVKARLERMSKTFGVPKNLVFPMMSNLHEFKRTPIIDLNALHVLKLLTRTAESRMEEKTFRGCSIS